MFCESLSYLNFHISPQVVGNGDTGTSFSDNTRFQFLIDLLSVFRLRFLSFSDVSIALTFSSLYSFIDLGYRWLNCNARIALHEMSEQNSIHKVMCHKTTFMKAKDDFILPIYAQNNVKFTHTSLNSEHHCRSRLAG